MRDQRDHQLALVVVDLLAGEQATDQRNTGEARDPGDGLIVLLLDQAAQEIDLAFFHANVVDHLLLANDGLVEAAEGNRPADVGNV